MLRNAVQVPVTYGEALTRANFRYQVFFNVTAKVQDNFEKTKTINI